MKRIISIVLMSLLVFSIGVPSYAVEKETDKNLLTEIGLKDGANLAEDYHKNMTIQNFMKSSESMKSILGKATSGVIQIGMAFMTNLMIHEMGHVAVADYVGAKGSQLNFFKKQGETFFLGTSIVDKIDNNSRLPYSMGGEMFTDTTFEFALKNYRQNPNLYNKSLLLFSGTDFLWYCVYAFYLSEGHPYFDPVAIAKEIGISKDTLFSIALAKTAINAYRVYSGKDTIIPNFTIDKNSAFVNVNIPF